MPYIPPLVITSPTQTDTIKLNPKWTGTLLVINDSIYTLELDFDDGRIRYVAANSPRAFSICNNKDFVYKIAYTLTVTSSSANVVTFELHEEPPATSQDLQGVGPIGRVVVLGNQGSIQTTGSNSLSNTGNPAGTAVITMADSVIPSGWNVEINNDGSMFINVLDSGSYTTVFSITPGSTTAPAIISMLRQQKLDSDAGLITSDGSGNLAVSGAITSGGDAVLLLGTGSFAGNHTTVSNAQPATAVKGDLWVKTPFT